MLFTEQLGILLASFNILGVGIALIWIVGSVFLSRVITETNEEWLIGLIGFMVFGMVLLFADKVEKIVLLVVLILLVLIGLFNRIGGKH